MQEGAPLKNGQDKFFVLLVGISFLQMVYYWPLMPEPMASHFDGMGHANGWAPRAGFFALYAGLLALFFIVFRVLPRQFNRIPDTLINLPNKGFWLAPERSESTFALLEQRMVLLGNATLILIMCTMQLVFQANRTVARSMSERMMWILLTIYVIFAVVWTVSLVRRFRRPQ